MYSKKKDPKTSAMVLLLTVMICSSIFFQSCGGDQPASDDTPEIGSIMHFGGYDWIILDIEDEKALLITKDIIMFDLYDESNAPYVQGVSWADCTLRKYLNTGFYNEFSNDEKSRILETSNTYFSDSNKTTSSVRDQIFILDISEAEKYFENAYARTAVFNVSEQHLKNEAEKRYNESLEYGAGNTYEFYYGEFKNNNGKEGAWDLRSFYLWGDQPHMSRVGKNGIVYEDYAEDLVWEGEGLSSGGDNILPCGQRPAMWIKLK